MSRLGHTALPWPIPSTRMRRSMIQRWTLQNKVGFCDPRLLHSPSLVAIGLSVGYETWPPIGWHRAFVIAWSKYRLELPSGPLNFGLRWPVGIPTVFQTPVTVPFHSPNGSQCLPLGPCNETVKESIVTQIWRFLFRRNSLGKCCLQNGSHFFLSLKYKSSMIWYNYSYV